jgi:WD40 repeat protein
MAAVEGPARALRESDHAAVAASLLRVDDVFARVAEPNGGRCLESMMENGRRVWVFESAAGALIAALDVAGRVADLTWPDGTPVRARFGLHAGEARLDDGRYQGMSVTLAGRICEEADWGEILLSETTRALAIDAIPAEYSVIGLGPFHLEGRARAEEIQALVGPGLTTTPTAGECPYRGLLAFGPQDRRFFFGREGVVRDVLSRVAPGRLMAVVGASGTGKSSLLQAGVLAATQSGELACARSARPITPGALPTLDLGEDVLELLIVDQFEELYTLCHDRDRRTRFIEALLSRRGPVVIGVRADFYGELGASAALAAAVASNQVLLGPMLDDDLRRTITEPARIARLRLQHGLLDVVLRDVAGEPGALPLLSHALRESWERREGRTLTIEAYEESGGVSSALAKSADAVVAETPEPDRPLLRNLFLRLTEVGADLEDTRRRAPIEELIPEGSSEEAVRSLLERLAAARLVVLDDGTAEVAHEVLIRRWPTLRRWLDEDREGIRLHRRLAAAARLWDASGRLPADLYRGTRLDAAVEWAGRHRALLNATEQDFLNTSVKDSARRQRLIVGASMTAVVVAILLAVFALISRNDASRAAAVAQSRALAADSTGQQTVDPELAVLLATRAVRTSPTADAMLALRDAIDASPVRRPLPLAGLQNNFGQSFGGDYLAYSPNGRWLAESSDHGPAVILDATTRNVVRRLRTPWPATLGVRAWSPDGRLLAVMTEHAVILANATTGAIVASIPQMPYAVGVAFSPDGRTVYGAGETPAGFAKDIGAPGAPTFLPVRSAVWVGAWDIATRRFRPFTLPSPTSTWAYSSVQSAALSPDGLRLAVGAFPGLAIFATGSGQAVHVLAGRFQHPPTNATPFPSGDVWVDLAYSPDGSLLAGADTHEVQGSIAPAGASARVLAGPALQPRATIPEAGKYQVATAIAFSPDGDDVAYGDGTGGAAVYSLRLQGELMSLPGLTTSVVSLAFSPNGTAIATSTKDGQGWIWRTASNEQLLITPAANPDTTTYAALLPDRVVAVLTPANGADAGKIVVESWSRTDGRSLTRPLVVAPLADPGAQASFSGDGRFIAVGDETDRHVAIWNIARRRMVASFTVPLHDLSYLGAATDWSPGDRYLAIPTFGHGHLWIWNRETGRLSAVITNPIDCNMAETTAWSPNGALIAATNNCGYLWIIDAATGHVVYSVNGLAPLVAATSFSPDGRQLILTSATTPHSVTVIDVPAGQTVLNLLGITANILGAFFSPNGSLIETTSDDGVARIWDARTGQLLHARPDVVGNGGAPDPWESESSSIVTVDNTGNIRVLDACTDCEDPAALLALAKTHINRQLTADERLIYHIGT